MDWAEVKKYLEDNKDSEDVKNLFDKPITFEAVKKFSLENPEGIKWLQAERDRAVTKGITSYEENTLPKKIEDAKQGFSKNLSPQEKRIAELEEKDRQRDIKEKKLVLKNLALTQISEAGLPVSLADKMVGEDEEKTVSNIKLFTSEFQECVTKTVEERLKKVTHKPDDTGSGGVSSTVNPWKKDTFNLTLQGTLITQDKEKARQLAKEAGIKPNF